MKTILIQIFLFTNFLFANTYPSQTINLIVGLGEGGSADRMSRNMAIFLEKELKSPITVKNIQGNASLDAANYILNQKHEGYNVFSSTFFPYLPNTILSGKASYSLDDFQIINFQWFEYDFIAVKEDSQYNTLLELLDDLKNRNKNLSASVIYKSSGHLLIKLLLEKLNIPQDRLKLKFFSGGKDARRSLLESKVDFLVIAAQGSEKYRNKIKPLAISSLKRLKRWDAPTLNEAIKSMGIEMPLINGPIRGFAVSKKFKENFPQRYNILEKAIKKTLARKKVQRILKSKNIGYSWIGPEKSSEILKNSYIIFKKYNYLLSE